MTNNHETEYLKYLLEGDDSDMLESQYRNKAAFFFIDVDNFKLAAPAKGRTERGEQYVAE